MVFTWGDRDESAHYGGMLGLNKKQRQDVGLRKAILDPQLEVEQL